MAVQAGHNGLNTQIAHIHVDPTEDSEAPVFVMVDLLVCLDAEECLFNNVHATLMTVHTSLIGRNGLIAVYHAVEVSEHTVVDALVVLRELMDAMALWKRRKSAFEA